MSQQYPGGLITKNPVVPSGPYENSSASGVWTMDQAAQYIKAGNWPTAGNFPNYIEDVFSTYLYAQNLSGQSINLKTNVGFTSTDAWRSSVVLTTTASSPVCAFDASGNYYMAMGNGTDSYVAKFTSSGSKTWLVRISPSANGLTIKSIRVAASGSVYVAGIRSGASAPFVSKLTSSGAISWTREITSGYNEDVYMDLDSSENVHIVYTRSLQGQYARFNSSGTQDTSVSKNFTTATQTFVRGITVDASGNVYICGRYYDSGTGYYYGYVIKFNSSMALQWNRALFSTTGDPSFNAVSVDSSANVYVTGTVRATYDVMLIAKYNSSGTLQWQKQVSRSTSSQYVGRAIKVDGSGNAYLCGTGTDPIGTSEWAVLCVDTSGALSWQKGFTPTMYGGSPFAYAIDANLTGELIVSGNSNETTSSTTNRAQVLKISQSGASYGMTDYGTLSQSNYTFGNASATADTKTFTVTAGSSFSSVTYTSASNSISTSLISIAASVSTGGLLWLKSRSVAGNHLLALSTSSYLSSNLTAAAASGTYLSALSSNGAVVRSDFATTDTYASWTFRKQAKFFDVVTYTGNGSNRTISHNLGSVPGCIIVKRTDTTANWQVYHRSIANTEYLVLNSTAAKATGTTRWNSTTPTSTEFSLGTDTTVNANGGTYVAYIFAHDAGGFGLSGTDNVISCGSFTMDGSGNPASVTLGYEPQMVIVKRTDSTSNWYIEDNMRGIPVTGNGAQLYANTSGAEAAQNIAYPNATGFTWNIGIPSATYIYIAIRRGPMKVPTSGTSVFSPSVYTTAPASPLTVTTNFPVDLSISQDIAGSVSAVIDRLRSVSASSVKYLSTQNTSAEGSTTGISLQNNTAIVDSGFWAGFAYKPVYWNFRRAPGFFDVVCYTGTGTATTVAHNLAAVPELMIVKSRTASVPFAWSVYVAPLGNSADLSLNNANSPTINDTNVWNATNPTSTVFSVGISGRTNSASDNFVAYLFATLAGVSKVGSYTGSGTTKQINCGFTAGARFVLIKRTDSTGDWYVYDSARGIVAGNDPYLFLNSTAAEVTSTDYVDTYSAGFELSSTAPAGLNANGGTYIFLAIA